MGSRNDILDTYIYENSSLLEQLESIILDAETINTLSQDNINEIFRIMHTIKGSSAMMEFETLASVAHRLEDMFFIIRENSMSVVADENKPEFFNMLFNAVDYFRKELEKIENEQPLDTDIDDLMNSINSLIDKISNKDSNESTETEETTSEEAVETTVKAYEENPDYPYEVLVFYDEGCGMENLRSLMVVSSIGDFCNESDFLFKPQDIEDDPSTADKIIENGFLLMFKNSEDREKAIPIIRTAGSVKSYQANDYEAPQKETEKKVEQVAENVEVKVETVKQEAVNNAPVKTTSSQAGTSSQSSSQHQKESLISVHQSKLDQLSALVGEIVITEAMVTGSPDLKGIENLNNFAKSARQLRKLTDELQDISMSLRMVPIATCFQKMNRIVRDMSKKLNKRVKLNIIGEDIEVDKTIVDNIGDPIMHMIRNAMDHGIEITEEERTSKGKNPVGEIILSAQDTGSEVIIEIRDDGYGVDDEAVLNKAIKNGLASPDVEYSHKEILNFLLMPGFSTNTEVTEFSGRGVGMDVVKRSVEELGGTVTITSQRGKGMTTTMKIPLTMAIMDGMEVSVGETIFTIPIQNIRQNFKVSPSDILHDTVSGEIIKIMDNFYPIIRTKELYSLPSGVDEIEDGILMWLESGDTSYCLLVDELMGEHQVVVKPLPAYVNSFDIKSCGIIGCSILGDGNISIILDAGNLSNAVFRK